MRNNVVQTGTVFVDGVRYVAQLSLLTGTIRYTKSKDGLGPWIALSPKAYRAFTADKA